MIDWFKNNLNVDKRHSFYVTFSYHLQSSKQKVKEVLITVTCVEKKWLKIKMSTAMTFFTTQKTELVF